MLLFSWLAVLSREQHGNACARKRKIKKRKYQRSIIRRFGGNQSSSGENMCDVGLSTGSQQGQMKHSSLRSLSTAISNFLPHELNTVRYLTILATKAHIALFILCSR